MRHILITLITSALLSATAGQANALELGNRHGLLQGFEPSKYRIPQFEALHIEGGKAYTDAKTIKGINDAVNELTFEREKKDDWKAPARFWRDGKGDCEDFALAKIYELKAKGWPNAWLAVVNLHRTGNAHAVALVEDNGEWLVLDDRAHARKVMTWREFKREHPAFYVLDVDTAKAWEPKSPQLASR